MKPFVNKKGNREIVCDVDIADACTSEGKYECLLTCSPYGNIEQWEGVPSNGYSCDKWIDICLKNYDCEKYVFVTDEKISKYKEYVAEYLENTSHWGSNTECVVVISKEQRNNIIKGL